jgi:hypothetical protein
MKRRRLFSEWTCFTQELSFEIFFKNSPDVTDLEHMQELVNQCEEVSKSKESGGTLTKFDIQRSLECFG